MINQREYDIRQLEAELKMQKLFDEWRRSFLADRLLPNNQIPQVGTLEMPEQEPDGDIRRRSE